MTALLGHLLHGLTCEEEEDEDHDHGIAKVEKGAGCSYDLQLGEEVVDRVDEQVDRREATGQERAPPPVVILDMEQTTNKPQRHTS